MKLGDHFFHAKYLSSDYSGQQMECKVTAIRRGCVYYRPYYGLHEDGTEWLGAPSYIAKDQFSHIVCKFKDKTTDAQP